MTDVTPLFAAYLERQRTTPTSPRLRFEPEAQQWLLSTFEAFCAAVPVKDFSDITVEVLQSWIDRETPMAKNWSHTLLTTFIHSVTGFLNEAKRQKLISSIPAPNLYRRLVLPFGVKSPIEKRLDIFYQEKMTFKGNTADTLKWFKAIFPMFLRDTFVREETEISRPMVKHWLAQGAIQRGWSEKTRRNYLQALGLFFDWSVAEGGLPENPIHGLSRPKLPKTKPRNLTEEQASTVLRTVQNMVYGYPFVRARAIAIIYLFFFTGLRREELRRLDREDVRLEADNPEIIVRQGKGKKDRSIPLPALLVPLLQTYIKERQRLKRSHHAFFVGLRHDQRIGVKAIPRLMDRIKKEVGFRCSPHMFRHTYASLLLDGGCSTRAMQDLLGHASVCTTELYTHVGTKRLRYSVEQHPLLKTLTGQPDLKTAVEPGITLEQALQVIAAHAGSLKAGQQSLIATG